MRETIYSRQQTWEHFIC